MASHARPLCPECATPLVPTLRGMACPKLASCGRGGTEEVGTRVRTRSARVGSERAQA